MIASLRDFIGTNQMMAYLVMMAARLVELHRVLKPTGSLYLHCDPTACRKKGPLACHAERERSIWSHQAGGVAHLGFFAALRMTCPGHFFMACHYLKIILDTIFGPKNFRNEIIWQRTNSKGNAFTRFATNHDTILRYTKSDNATWNPQYTAHDPEYVENFYRYVEPETG